MRLNRIQQRKREGYRLVKHPHATGFSGLWYKRGVDGLVRTMPIEAGDEALMLVADGPLRVTTGKLAMPRWVRQDPLRPYTTERSSSALSPHKVS